MSFPDADRIPAVLLCLGNVWDELLKWKAGWESDTWWVRGVTHWHTFTFEKALLPVTGRQRSRLLHDPRQLQHLFCRDAFQQTSSYLDVQLTDCDCESPAYRWKYFLVSFESVRHFFNFASHAQMIFNKFNIGLEEWLIWVFGILEYWSYYLAWVTMVTVESCCRVTPSDIIFITIMIIPIITINVTGTFFDSIITIYIHTNELLFSVVIVVLLNNRTCCNLIILATPIGMIACLYPPSGQLVW